MAGFLWPTKQNRNKARKVKTCGLFRVLRTKRQRISSTRNVFEVQLDPMRELRLDEMALQKEYLDIEKERFSDRMIVRIDIPPELEGPWSQV
ncbi:hypothetical protein [Ensifer sp. B1-9]|uniref:hypothetical protein n=1 Tax=Ensifer sp. B1-9 TaxID=3141455 RepID=UPI003D202F4F